MTKKWIIIAVLLLTVALTSIGYSSFITGYSLAQKTCNCSLINDQKMIKKNDYLKDKNLKTFPKNLYLSIL